MDIIEIDENDENYPIRLKITKQHPKVIYALGNIGLLESKNTVGIVGSRDCSEYGRKVTDLFSSKLSRKGICIVSGMASGIDTHAHNKAIENAGKTIAVLGNGFDYIYPPENEWLFHKILANGGCIITENKKDVKPDLSKFPKRNRIISALSDAILVVEAQYRSGTSVTVKYAKEYKKTVFAIPSNIDSTKGVGTNRMIAEGALLTTKPEEIIDSLKNAEYSKEEIPNEYKNILNIINNNPMNINKIAKKLCMKIQDINATITMMELEGYIIKNDKNEYQRGK